MEPQFEQAEHAEQPSARRRETQLRLLDAATAVFSELGLQGASVESICGRAGFSRGAFYSNFSSKEQLFLALLDREFTHRARDLSEKALALEPILLTRNGGISPAEAAQYITEFFGPPQNATSWFVLEAEFLLLAMRDPEMTPGHQQLMDSFYARIAGTVEQVLSAAGRRFSFSAEHAMPVLSGVYERALRAAALGGPGADRALDGLGERMAELLFAITEPL